MTRYRAVLFDVDGTLYRQTPLRAMMALELAAAPVLPGGGPGGMTTARILRCYRQMHESLRQLGAADRPLADDQIMRTASALGVGEAVVRSTVDEWMVRRPLKYLRWCRRPGLIPALEALAAAGIRLGVLSDYAPEHKLAALGTGALFELSLCTSAGTVNALKPHPRGFQLACRMWGLDPAEVLYVGDRPEVDGEGALAAGLDCAIIGRRTRDGRWRSIRHFDELQGHLFHAA